MCAGIELKLPAAKHKAVTINFVFTSSSGTKELPLTNIFIYRLRRY